MLLHCEPVLFLTQPLRKCICLSNIFFEAEYVLLTFVATQLQSRAIPRRSSFENLAQLIFLPSSHSSQQYICFCKKCFRESWKLIQILRFQQIMNPLKSLAPHLIPSTSILLHCNALALTIRHRLKLSFLCEILQSTV